MDFMYDFVIFNCSIESGDFRIFHEIGRVTSLHKKGPRNFPDNYRLISILSTISKIFERMVNFKTQEILFLAYINDLPFSPTVCMHNYITMSCLLMTRIQTASGKSIEEPLLS